MAKFIMGLLVGIVIGLLSSSYFSSAGLNDLTNQARSGCRGICRAAISDFSSHNRARCFPRTG